MRHSARHYSRNGQPTQANVSLNEAERLGKKQEERAFFECAVSGVQNLAQGNAGELADVFSAGIVVKFRRGL